MTLGDTDIAVSCRILIDGEVVVEKAGEVNVGCMLLPDEMQAMIDEMQEEYAEQSAEQQTKNQEQMDELPEAGTPEYEEYLRNLMDKVGDAQQGNG